MAKKLRELTGEEFVDGITNGERDFSSVKLPEDCDINVFRGCISSVKMQAYLKKHWREFQEKPINISDSDLTGLIAPPSFRVPYLIGRNAVLNGANLWRAKLWKADLRGAKLRGANLNESEPWGADLRDADLEGAHLERAQLSRNAKLQNANLKAVKAKLLRCEESDLNEAIFEGGDLRGAEFQQSDFKDVNFKKANLSGANFWGSDLETTDLEKANLKSTSFANTDLRGVKNLEKAKNLGGARFRRTIVTPKEAAIIRKVKPRARLFIVGSIMAGVEKVGYRFDLPKRQQS